MARKKRITKKQELKKKLFRNKFIIQNDEMGRACRMNWE
jgi:hypothetical protein